MRSLFWSLFLTAVITLSGCAKRADDPATTPGPGSTAAPGTATTDTAGQSASQKAAAKMTEQDYDAIMKKVGPTYASMQKNLKPDGDLAEAGKNAEQLAELFGEAEKFWAQYNKDDAVKWAQTARTYATQIAGGLAASQGMRRSEPRVQRGAILRVEKVTATATEMGALCKQCHSTYREGDAASGFRMKPGVLTGR
jgi:cytochrome c556